MLHVSTTFCWLLFYLANGNIGAVEGEDVRWLLEHHSLSWEFQSLKCLKLTASCHSLISHFKWKSLNIRSCQFNQKLS